MARRNPEAENRNYFQRNVYRYLDDSEEEKKLSDRTGLSLDAVDALMRNGKGKGKGKGSEFDEFCDKFVDYLNQIGVDVSKVDKNSTLHYLNAMQKRTRH